MLRALVILSLALSACSVGRPAADATGQEIYQQLCSNCHGDDLSGRLGPPLGPGSNSAELADEFLDFAIRRGRGRMPSFSSTLNDEQITRLIGYIREVQTR
ncbi:MAG: cytochrome c [Acidimicrobiia bacterium]